MRAPAASGLVRSMPTLPHRLLPSDSICSQSPATCQHCRVDATRVSHREPSMTTRGQGTRRRILLAAARLLAARGAASMADIAAAAGITRGTLYRYFPARESLIQALEAAANEEAGRRLAEANLDQVPVEEGLARAIRALVTVGEDFIVLLRER